MKTLNNISASSLIETLASRLQSEQNTGWVKLQNKIASTEAFEPKAFFFIFAICSRWFSKAASTLSLEQNSIEKKPELETESNVHYIRMDKDENTWSWVDVARVYLLLLLWQRNDSESYQQTYRDLYHSADVKESILLIKSLAFLPDTEAFISIAREAARSNITSLFSAIAHNNDYPMRYFDMSGWNQLILKAAFLAVPIWSIVGLKQRNNAALAEMLSDYARERQLASRSVPWDLWCCVGWSASTTQDLAALEKQFEQGDKQIKAAIALSLIENNDGEAHALGNRMAKQMHFTKTHSVPDTWQEIATIS